MQEDEDPFAKAQGWMFMASGSISTHNIIQGKYYLKRCLDIVKRNDIRFVPHSEGAILSSTLEITEEVHERVVFLGQLIYWLGYMYLLDGHSEDDCSDLELQFRFELPVCDPFLWGIR